MYREDIIDAVKSRLAALGVPRHVCSVRKVPAFVEASVLMGDKLITLKLRTKITSTEMEEKLADFEAKWRVHKRAEPDGHQIDLEEAIAAAKAS